MTLSKFCRHEESVPSLGLHRGTRIEVMKYAFYLVLLLGLITFSSILLKAVDAQASVGSPPRTPINQSNSTLSNTSAIVLVGERLIDNSQLVQKRLANIVNELEGIRNAISGVEKPIVTMHFVIPLLLPTESSISLVLYGKLPSVST